MPSDPSSHDRGAAESLSVLKTKLYQPPTPDDVEVRKQLLKNLEEKRHRPVTLISAAAGYGKTTLASMWLKDCDCSTAWLSLDERDNDLRTFLIHFVAAVQTAFPDTMSDTQAALRTPILASEADLARRLLNDLSQCGEPFILALDDVHFVTDQKIHDVLYELLRHPLPTFHLVIITRKDPPLPIPLLRAREQITEIRARDLRFSIAETASLLTSRLGREVDEADAAKWTQKSEGWVTAITLAALSLQYRAPGADLSKFIQRKNVFLQDYLVDEVLTQLSPIRQEWLLATSLLDRFCAPICECMCQTEGPPTSDEFTGEEFIQWLQAGNLFVVPLDDRRQWFRFHHLFQALLQDSLRKQRDPNSVATYHIRASRWLAENNLIDEALEHAIAGGETDSAVRIFNDHRHDLLNTGQWHRLELWIRQFPEAVVSNDPVLFVTKCQLPMSHGMDWAHAISEANRLVASMPADSPVRNELLGEIVLWEGMWPLMVGSSEQTIAAGTNALSLLPPRALRHRCQATAIHAFGHQMAGDYVRSLELFDAALQERQWTVNNQAHLLLYKSQVCFMQGDLEATRRFAHGSMLLAKQVGIEDIVAQAHKYQGIVHFLRNELDQAEVHLSSAVHHLTFLDPPYLASATCVLARIHEVHGRPEDADAVMKASASFLRSIENSHSLETLAAYQIELALQRGDTTLARTLANEIHIELRRPVWHSYLPQLTLIKLSLVDATPGSLEEARSSLRELDEHVATIHRNAARIDVLSLLALVCYAQGEIDTASEALAQALDLAEPGGFARNFVDLGPPMADLLVHVRVSKKSLRQSILAHIDRLLDAFPEQQQAGARLENPSSAPQGRSFQPEQIEPLTRREATVLKLLATDSSPQDIADTLSISTATVETHIKHIYRKIDVHSRYEAIQRGRDLNLIS